MIPAAHASLRACLLAAAYASATTLAVPAEPPPSLTALTAAVKPAVTTSAKPAPSAPAAASPTSPAANVAPPAVPASVPPTATVQAQPSVPALPLGEYLRSAREDAVLMARKGGGELAFSSWSGLPLVRDLEFRVRNDAFNPDNMRYTVRVEPRGFGEDGAARRFNEAEVRRSRHRDRLLLNRALVDRYMLAIDWLAAGTLHDLNAELFVVLRDRIKVLDSRKTTEDFDLADLVEAESDLTKVHFQELELRKELDVMEQRAALQAPAALSVRGFPGFDTTGFASVDDIIAEVEGGGFALDTGHVYLEYLKEGLSLAESRYGMEKAGGNRYLSFLSFSYDVGERIDEMGRRDDGKDYDLSRAYVLEAGFRLPFLTTGNAELNRRRADLLSEKEDYRGRRAELEEVMRKDILDLHSLVAQYRYLRARETQVDAQASLKKYLQMTGVDPLALLAIKGSDLRNRLKLAEMKYGILRNWIKVLDASGRLAREPLRNWLAADKAELRP